LTWECQKTKGKEKPDESEKDKKPTAHGSNQILSRKFRDVKGRISLNEIVD
jgi:hypothetical protein